MGWWPSKICVVLNWVIEIGYGLVDCLIAGLLLSAVNGHGMSPIVGIVISALITVNHVPFERDLFFLPASQVTDKTIVARSDLWYQMVPHLREVLYSTPFYCCSLES